VRLTVLPNAATYAGSKYFVAGFSEALSADLSGTGVTVAQVWPGPIESEFDEVSGFPRGMVAAPPQFFCISAARCAREARAGFERGNARVFPGRDYRFVVGVLPLLLLWLRSKQAAHAAARLRATRNG
jgi:short-subunit dehydrogenase